MLNQKTVLLVEDDFEDRDLFIIALDEIENVTLFDFARNGKDAINRLRCAGSLPNIIFMDIEMPIMNGLECLRELARDPILSSIPVVMLSSAAQYKDLARLLGASDFIVKPQSVELLRERIEEMIQWATPALAEQIALTV